MASNNSGGGNVTLRMIIPGKEIGVIIGKGGETINQIRQDSAAKIFITDASVPERVITVTDFPQMPGFHGPAPPMDGRRGGPPDPRMGGMGMGGPPMPNNPLAALAMTARNHMSSRRAGSSGEEASHIMTIGNDLIGVIIGKGGSKIAEIRHMSGAMIQISKNEKGDEGEESKERSITITGSPESVTLAKNLINMTLELHQLDRHEDNLDDERPPRRGGYDNMRYDNRAPQHEELMKAINTITQFGMGAAAASYMGGGGAGFPAGGMRGGGRPQNGAGPRGGGGHRDDRNGAGGAGPLRNKFSPY